MYKLLLSSRYLRTRFIALASIISVMLGVATLIVVNSVMTGFRYEMRDRLHSLISDVVIESRSTDGAENPEELVQHVWDVAGEYVEAVAPTVEIYGMLTFELPMQRSHNKEYAHCPVTIIGINPEEQDAVSPIREHLVGRQPTTDDEGKIIAPPLFHQDVPLSWELSESAKEHRKNWLEMNRWMELAYGGAPADAKQPHPFYEAPATAAAAPDAQGEPDPFNHTEPVRTADLSPDANPGTPAPNMFDPTRGQSPSDLFTNEGIVTKDPNEPFSARLYVGQNLIGYPMKNPDTGKTEIQMLVHPGEDVHISTIKTGLPEPARFTATVVDVFRSGMSEFDSNFVFCPIEELQKVRGMLDPATGQGDVTMLKLKLRNYDDAGLVVERLRTAEDKFPARTFNIYTWEQKRAPLLQAVEIEAAILNVLLFLIIAVAGFGILAIFYMIVVEKTRDIGILKALGATSHGVMSIFLTYGLSLGIVGSGVGVVLGLLFVYYINEIESAISWLTGRKVFDDTIYYFQDIPTAVSPWMVVWVALGAMAIAVLASVLPARRAARLHPVRALRYE
ncbi:MAG: ABC transporter permease [Planctomycetaceae bacterium]|nr:ABC transporter permease [Planctomycetaceae bacterium]